MATIRTDRGLVHVANADCKHRPCLHPHWSRNPHTQTTRQRDGARICVHPLVCIRREDHGCPYPLPEPVKPPRADRRPKPATDDRDILQRLADSFDRRPDA